MSEMMVRETQSVQLSTKAENLIASGDLAPLSPEDRIAYYRMRCEAAGLDYRTVPFLYVTLNGKLVLYPTKGATEQLARVHGISIKILTKGFEEDAYEVWCRASDASGRSVDNMGAVYCETLKGQALCDAKMKTVTKAQRRTTLAFCGLGMLDESEVDDIPDAKKVPIEQAHGEAPPLRLVAGETVDADGVIEGEMAEEIKPEPPKKAPAPPSSRLRSAVRKVWDKAELELNYGAVCTALRVECESDSSEEAELESFNDAGLIRMLRYAMIGQPMTPDAILPLPEEILAEAKEFLGR